MSAIKRFFEKKKLDRKFKKAGGGHSLNEVRHQPSPQRSARPTSSASRGPTLEQQHAAEAALTRLNAKPAGSASLRTSKEAIKAQVKREMEQEKKQAAQVLQYSSPPTEVHLESAQVISSCGGVFFTCDLIPKVMLPKKEMDEKIKEFLTEQLSEDAEMASALLIHTANKDIEKVRVCIETLCKYIDNLLSNPGDEKFRKIRCNNKAFQERVAAVTGGTQFLLCAGYQLMSLPFQDGNEEFYVISEEGSLDAEKLNHLKEVLTNAEPIQAQLWRAERVFHCPGNSTARFGELPPEFYARTRDELKREQQAKTEAVEKLGMIRTKAMKERDEIRELRRYRFTLLRIRFPDDIFLQAIFKSNETLKDLQDFIRDHIEFDWLPFWVLTPGGQKLTEDTKTLAELQLVPACVINFRYDKELLQEAQQGSEKGNTRHILQQQFLDRLENWAI